MQAFGRSAIFAFLVLNLVAFGSGDVNGTATGNGTETDPSTADGSTLLQTGEQAVGPSMNASQVPVTSRGEYTKFLQTYEQILLEELENMTVPSDGISRAQVLTVVLQNFDFFHVARRLLTLNDIRRLLPKPESVNQRCYDNVIDFLDALIGERDHASSTEFYTQEWAARMFDAFGKPPSGVLRGALQWVGNYKECLNLRAHIRQGALVGSRPTARETSSEFKARYCRVQMLLPNFDFNQDAGGFDHIWRAREEVPRLLHWGMCVPEACKSSDVVGLLTQGTAEAFPLDVQGALCFDRHQDIGDDAGAIVAVFILASMAGVLIVCTVLESAIHQGYIDLGRKGQRQGHSSGTTAETPAEDPEKVNGHTNIQMKEDCHGNTEKLSVEMTIDGMKQASNDQTPTDVPKDEGQRSDQRRVRKSLGMQLLESFSLRHNANKLLSTTSGSASPGVFMSIQGIRVISICWVVLGHTYTVGGSMDARNYVFGVLQRIPENVSRMSNVVILAANLAVDTFFTMSGLLVMALTLREVRKRKGGGVAFWIMFYVHRIFRLTPVYMMVLMTGTTLYDYIVEGPLKSDPYLMFEHCPNQWWTNFLYVNNLVYPNNECMFWTWYLATDMQLYIISPIFIILVYWNRRTGLIALLVTIVLGTVGSLVITYFYPGNILTMTTTNTEYWEYVYRAPWSRVGVFAVGLTLGVIMEDPKKSTMSSAKAFLIWAVLTSCAIFVIIIPHDGLREGSEFWPGSIQGPYEAGSRLLWSVYIGWIIYACQTGLGGFVSQFLSSQVFQPLARLTYTVYLVHPMIITFFIYSNNFPVTMDDGIIIIRFLGNVVMSYIVAAGFSLAFESTFMGVEKALLFRK